MKESEKSKNLAIDGDILLYSIGWVAKISKRVG